MYLEEHGFSFVANLEAPKYWESVSSAPHRWYSRSVHTAGGSKYGHGYVVVMMLSECLTGELMSWPISLYRTEVTFASIQLVEIPLPTDHLGS